MLINDEQISGWMDGDDIISAERNTDAASFLVGGDGKMLVSISPDKSGTATFRLKQSSPSGLFLSGLVNDMQNGNFAPVSFLMKDTKGDDIVSGSKGFILRPSTMTRGIGANAQEWAVVLENMQMTSGSSATI